MFPGGTDFVSDGAYEVIVNKKLPELRRLYQDYFSRTGVAAIPGLVLPASGLPVAIELDAPAGSDRALLALGMSVADVLGPVPPPRI